LHEEGEDVADNENFGHASRADDGRFGGVDEDRDAAKDHVDCCGVEGGWKDDKEGLQDVRHQFGGILGGEVTCHVADCHHLLHGQHELVSERGMELTERAYNETGVEPCLLHYHLE